MLCSICGSLSLSNTHYCLKDFSLRFAAQTSGPLFTAVGINLSVLRRGKGRREGEGGWWKEMGREGGKGGSKVSRDKI